MPRKPRPCVEPIEFYIDRHKEHRWRLRSANGNILADSGEGYRSKRGARNGLRAVLALLTARFV